MAQSVVAEDPQIRTALLCLQDRRLSLAGQILEGISLEQRLPGAPSKRNPGRAAESVSRICPPKRGLIARTACSTFRA